MAEPKATDAVDARSLDLGDLEPMTPAVPGASVVASQAKHAYFEVTTRQPGVLMVYEGRKSMKGHRMPTPPGEHIDVTVPGPDNEGAAELYLERLVMGPKTDQLQAELDKMLEQPDGLHLSGNTYHFISRKATVVRPEDVAFLDSHPGYFFTQTHIAPKDDA
jgi:hypothetical protein